MIRKNHNHTLQTNPRHHEKEPENTNSHKTLGRQLKQLSRPDLDDCKTRKDAKKCITKQITTQDHSNSFEVHKTMNQQQGGGGGVRTRISADPLSPSLVPENRTESGCTKASCHDTDKS